MGIVRDQIFNGNREQLGRYVRELADRMGLMDWKLKLGDGRPPRDSDDPPPYREAENDAACVHIVYGRKVAVVWFADDWADWEMGELRQTATHELVHCHLQGMQWALNNVQELVPAMTMNVVNGAFRDMCEIATDGIAMAWAETLPLPSEWLEQATETEGIA
jgi:hypothetical protein